MRARSGHSLRARHRGLTLIELLVAITILAFIAVLGWRGLDSIVRTRITLTDDLEQTRGMQLAFAQLQNDCAQLADSYLLHDRIPLIVESGRLKLVRTVFSEDQPSRLQIVSYRLDNGVLLRTESPETRDLAELDILWKNSAAFSDSSREVKLLSGVKSFDMRLWSSGGNSWINGEDALKLGNSANPPPNAPAGKFPLQKLTGLEVKLQLTGHNASLIKIFLLGVV